jgi:uncharacterized membrane protein (DUF373 family)
MPVRLSEAFRLERARPVPDEAGTGTEGVAMRLFARIVDVVLKLLMLLAIVALMVGVARVFLDLAAVWRSKSISAGFDLLVTDILSMFVVIELMKSVIEYIEIHRLKITFILDAAVVFILREVMIGLYKHAMGAAEIGALSVLLIVLGGFRIATVSFWPRALAGRPVTWRTR